MPDLIATFSDRCSDPRMRTFTRDLILFLGFQAFVLGAFLGLFYRPALANPLVATTVLKHRLLREQVPPRVILVGGSNVLYGFDSPTIQQQTGLNPVNMGLIGGLRLDYLLNEVQCQVQDGDLVVLALEYNQLLARFGTPRSAVILAQVLENRVANVQYIRWHHLRKLADHGLVSQLGLALREAIKRARRLGRNEKKDMPKVNEFGDLLEHRDQPMQARARQHRPMKRRFDWSVVDGAINRLNRFAEHCRSRGAEVIYTFPPIPKVQFGNLAKVIQMIEVQLKADLELPLVNRPSQMVFPISYFYDSANHLRGEGVFERSRRVADSINRYREDIQRTHCNQARE